MLTFHVRQINHGQSEVWVESGKVKVVATNGVRNCVQASCDADTFNAFKDAYPPLGKGEVTFQVPEDAARKYGLIQ